MKKNSKHCSYYGQRFKISFKYRPGKNGVKMIYCNSFTQDDWFLYPKRDDGSTICCISCTNIVSVEEFTSNN